MATTIPRQSHHRRFWTIADTFITSGQVIEGTMMGHHCLRATSNGGFVATVERSTGNLVVKAPADQVRKLIATGEGPGQLTAVPGLGQLTGGAGRRAG